MNIMRKEMGKTGDSFGRDYSYEEGRFSKNVRLNLNDLIQRRKDEKMTEKKMNLKIFSVAGGLAVCIVILVLSL
tara:strand:- start:498 stop:719 length:222 start_codon:yes stop_codon:yes gene_type:complete